jgi:hypothetical protein
MSSSFLAQHIPISGAQEKLPLFGWTAIPSDLARVGFISKHNELAAPAQTSHSHKIWKKRLDRQQHLVV